MCFNKSKLFFLGLIFFLFIGICQAEQSYNPPFQISGIVKNLNESKLEVYLPYVDKQITVHVFSDTKITNRMDEKIPQNLDSITEEDLVVIKGVLKDEVFCCKEISFLPSS